MSAWWTKIDGKVERHSGRKPKLGAAIAISFARARGVSIEKMHLYKRDPEKHPDAEDFLPVLLAKAARSTR